MATSKDFYFKIWKERSKGSACVINCKYNANKRLWFLQRLLNGSEIVVEKNGLEQ